MVNIVELIEGAKDDLRDFAVSVGKKTVVKIAGTPVGEAAIKKGIKDFLTADDMREQTAEAAAEEVVALKEQIKQGTEPFLKQAASEMGVDEAPAWKQIYNRISSPDDFFLVKPVKGLFALVLSGVASAASFFTTKAVNAFLKPKDANKITKETVKSVYIGLFAKAFPVLRTA